MSSADTSIAFIPAVDDGWAILSEPPGSRDLALPDYWRHSFERSRRRREARRSVVVERSGVKVGLALAALTVGGTAGGVSGADDAAAHTTSHSVDLARGSSGPAVSALQRKLGIPADGIFGPRTERAVKRFQRANGIQAIGRVGPKTTAALGLKIGAEQRRSSSVEPRRASAPAAVDLPRNAARAMQTALGVSADGIVGPRTRAALKRYEARQGMPADGRPDAEVLAALGVDPDAAAPKRETVRNESGSTAPAPTGEGAAAAARHALRMTGTPYASGGNGPNGFDCSGLTVFAFKKAGVSLPRTSFAQYDLGSRVRRSQIRTGDLVFFDTSGPGASHVGIATGPNSVVSATTHGVMQHAISDGYWGSHYVGARRL